MRARGRGESLLLTHMQKHSPPPPLTHHGEPNSNWRAMDEHIQGCLLSISKSQELQKQQTLWLFFFLCLIPPPKGQIHAVKVLVCLLMIKSQHQTRSYQPDRADKELFADQEAAAVRQQQTVQVDPGKVSKQETRTNPQQRVYI